MKGVAILVHSVRLLVNNLEVALRISLVPYIAIVFMNLYTASVVAPYQQIAPHTIEDLPPTGVYVQIFASALGAFLLSLWIAVAWHRYVLTSDAPNGYLPTWHGDRILAYFGKGLAIGILLLLMVAVLTVVVGPLVPVAFGGAVIAFFALIAFYRVCAVLPAAALGEPLSFAQAWQATRGETGTIIVLSFVGGLALLALSLPSMLGSDPDGLINQVYSAVVGWFTMIIGVSILTTFYGHFVEGRAID